MTPNAIIITTFVLAAGAAPLSPDDQKIVQEAVRSELKDPESARFGKMLGSTLNTTSTVVCGLVNAKNSFGGYVGMHPFIGMLLVKNSGEKQFALIGGVSHDNASVKATLSVCKDSGITF